MKKEMVVIVLGLWVALLPFLGFPQSWREVMYTLAGLCVALLAFLMRRERRGGHHKDSEAPFAQNGTHPIGHGIFTETHPSQTRAEGN